MEVEEGQVGLVAVEDRQAGEVGSALCLDSNLCKDSVRSLILLLNFVQYLENFIFVQHSVALAMELGNVVGDRGGAIDSAIGARRTWHSKTKEVGASTLLSLVRE